eukprot:GHRQ01015220.1.p1 GENE.GHRQ01015220.1~~GHRQ01015220.1.p1  ORF type:complete len:179 (-),score=48.91 GHRQ01015220.1:887-1423(-)
MHFWLRGTADDRLLPMPVPGGGLLSGLVGGLLNTAVQGLAKEMENSAKQTRSVADLAAERISSSRRIKQRLGEVTVGLPISQSVASQSINGRVSKTVSLVLPVYNLAGVPVAQAQVTQAEGPAQNTCRIAVSKQQGISVGACGVLPGPLFGLQQAQLALVRQRCLCCAGRLAYHAAAA